MRKQLVISMGLALTLIVAIVLGRGLIFAQSVVGQRSPGLSDGSAVATRIALPALDVGDGWETTIRVQNAGGADTRAVLELYPVSDGQCPAEGSVVGTLCSGLIAPGTAWVWNTSDLPASAGSAIVYSVLPGTEDVACGGDGTRQPGQPIAVTVDRLREEAGVMPAAASVYAGVPQERAGTFDPTVNGFPYYVPLVTAAYEGQSSTLIVQNLGDECASVELWYQPQDDCLQVTMDEVPALAPGEAVRVNPGDVLTVPFRGSAWIRADQPLAVVADRWAAEGSVLMTSRGVALADSSLINYAPLVYKNFEGWNAEVYVQNTSSAVTTTAEIDFLDFGGNVITTDRSFLCSRGSGGFSLQGNNELSDHYQGAAEVKSLDGGADILSVVNLVNEETGQGVGYNAFLGTQGGGTEVVGLPRLMRGTTRASRIIIQNLNSNPGFTDFTFSLYDQNGLLDYVYEKLGGGQKEHMDLGTWGYLLPGFLGSALLQVTYSTQDGEPVLGVVVLEPDDGTTGGDLSMAYEGVVLSTGGVEPVTPTSTPPTTPEPTATATSIATPTPSPTATPTGSSPPTITPTPTSTPIPFPPDTRITLPSIVTGDGWETGIHVQNAGEAETQVVMDLYAASTGLCPPESPDVIATLCSGLLKPGSTWTWTSSDLPQEARSAIVYSVLPDGKGTRRPGSPLAVTVERLRRGEGGAVLKASSYTGIAQWGEPDPESGNYVYFTPVTLGGLSGWNTSMTAQNAGEACTSLKIVYRASADGRESTFEIPALAPGEAVQIDPRDKVPSPFQGSAWIESPQPLAILVDQWFGEDGPFMSSSGGIQSLGARISYAPLAYRGFEGWAASIQVQNLSATTDARVRADFLDYRGDVLATVREWLLPLGSQIFLDPTGDSPEQQVDAVRIESQDWGTGEPSSIDVPRILSWVSLTNEETGQSLSYNAFSVREEGTAALVALPWLVKDAAPSSRIVVQNLNDSPGFTDLQIEFYDPQGLRTVRFDRLGLNETHVIDLDLWSGIPQGWSGAGLVRVMGSTQGASSVGIIVIEEGEGLVSGDISRGYEGVPFAPRSAPYQSYLPVIVKGD